MMWVIPGVLSLENSNLLPLHPPLPVSRGVEPEMASGPTLGSPLFPLDACCPGHWAFSSSPFRPGAWQRGLAASW